MIENELYVEDGVSGPKKIGGIEVDPSEVRRAKKCEFFPFFSPSQNKIINILYSRRVVKGVIYKVTRNPRTCHFT